MEDPLTTLTIPVNPFQMNIHDPKTTGGTPLIVYEGNVVSSIVISVGTIVLDALTALPTTMSADVPTSLRVTALVLVMMLASPPIAHRHDDGSVDLFAFETQRIVVLVLLGIASFMGLHQGDLNARLADATFVLLGTLSMVFILVVRGRGDADSKNNNDRRENFVALAASLLAYGGMRAARAGVAHAGAVDAFTMRDDDVEVRGLALADDLVAATLVFGGVVQLCAALFVFASYDEIQRKGCAAVHGPIGTCGILVFTSAFVVQTCQLARLDDLKALFGTMTCIGDAHVCASAIRARRFHMSNFSPASLWSAAVALALLAFPQARRSKTRYETHTRLSLFDVDGANFVSSCTAALSFVVSILVVGLFADLDVATRHLVPSVQIALMYGSIPLAWWFSQSFFAIALHLVGLLLYISNRISGTGYDLSFLTHWGLGTTVCLLSVLLVSTFFTHVVYRYCEPPLVCNLFEIVSATCLTALESIQMLLLLSSLSLTAAYDGGPLINTVSWTAHSFEWHVQHTLSFFFISALIEGRFEVAITEFRRVRLIVWICVPLLLILSWGVRLLWVADIDPYRSHVDVGSCAIALISAFVTWISVGFMLR